MIQTSCSALLQGGWTLEGKQLTWAINAALRTLFLDGVKPTRGKLPVAPCGSNGKLTNVATRLDNIRSESINYGVYVYHAPCMTSFLSIGKTNE